MEVIRPGGLAPQKAPRIQNALRHIREATGGYDLDFLAGDGAARRPRLADPGARDRQEDRLDRPPLLLRAAAHAGRHPRRAGQPAHRPRAAEGRTRRAARDLLAPARARGRPRGPRPADPARPQDLRRAQARLRPLPARAALPVSSTRRRRRLGRGGGRRRHQVRAAPRPVGASRARSRSRRGPRHAESGRRTSRPAVEDGRLVSRPEAVRAAHALPPESLDHRVCTFPRSWDELAEEAAAAETWPTDGVRDECRHAASDRRTRRRANALASPHEPTDTAVGDRLGIAWPLGRRLARGRDGPLRASIGYRRRDIASVSHTRLLARVDSQIAVAPGTAVMVTLRP